jgi:polar amino acid transport system substrate-binding protein
VLSMLLSLQKFTGVGKSYPRFDGLLNNRIDIECGSNSISSLNLKINENEDTTFGDKIELSKTIFHTTGIKLLLKKDTANDLNRDLNNLENKLRDLSIAVMRQTTTLNEFKNNDQYYRGYIPYPKIEKSNSKLDVRDLALDDLGNSVKPFAFASDSPMLQTLFENGVEGESQFVKHRNPYKDTNNYTIFPAEPGSYLPHLNKQFYAVAISKETN